MINCRYEYKGHTFNNEVALDDFLISKAKYEGEFGDLIFQVSASKLGTMSKAKKINEQTRDMKKAFNVKAKYFDGEDISERPKPFIGVTSYLASYLREDESPLFPIFREEEYWKRRRLYWADENQDINEDYDAKTGKGVYTKEERQLIFGDGPVRRLTPEEMDIWQKIITEKWQQQGEMGSELHHVLEMYFTKYNGVYNFVKFKDNREGLIKLIQRNINVKPEIINQTLDFAEKLRQSITEKLGDKELEFYPELKISGKLAELRNDGVDTLVGSIDLLVVDSNGNSHIFDYKTSPKVYSDYNSAKVRAFMYQFAVYNRLLEQFGFKVDNNRQFVAPLQFQNFHLTNKDEAIADPSKAKFGYDGVAWREEQMLEELTQAIRNDDSLNVNCDNFLPHTAVRDVDSDKIIERVREDTGKLFGGQVKHKSYTDADIADFIKDVKPNEQGAYSFYIPGGYSNTPIRAKSAAELHRKVKEFFAKVETGGYRRAKTIVDALKYGIANNTDNIGDYLQYMETKKLFDESGDLGYLKKQLSYYCNSNWEVIEDDAALYFGMVMLQNTTTKQIDVIKISGKNLKNHLYYETIVNGKKVQNKRRSNLTFAWEVDSKEKSKPRSRMLQAVNGNVEMVEALLVLNQKYSLFTNGGKIGHIQVINPFIGQGLSATNEELKYSYEKLRSYSKIQDGVDDNILSGNIKFASLLDLAENDLRNIIESKEKNNIRNKEDFKSAHTVLDSAEDTSDKLKAINKLLDLIKKNYREDVGQLKSNSSSQAARIYNKLLLAAAELKGITFRQQLATTDKWPSLSIKKLFNNGLASSYIDNPGNLESETLNMLTQLVTQGYQDIRTEMAEYIPKIRELTEKLKKSKNFGWIVSRTLGNETSIFSNLFDNTYTDDLVLKHVNDSTLTTEEREFLVYFLDVVNKNRHGKKSQKQIQEMRDSGDIEYYRVPLSRGSVSSEVAMQGLYKTLIGRLSKWTPRNALKELRATAEGIFTDDYTDAPAANENNNLFEMNNRFERGDTDEEYRLQSIVDNGKAFFERNLETLLLEHTFAYSTKKHLDEVFPMIRAAMTHIKVMGEDQQNVRFDQDLQYAKDYIMAVIKSQPIDKNLQEMELTAITGKLKQAASFAALAFSPVIGLYQMIQGLWVDLSLIIRKPDGTNAFTFNNFLKAGRIVYGDMFNWSETPSKVQLLNELYAVNDMDMNTYMKNVKSDRHGIFNAYDLAFKFASRPDYYNRMSILVAQMIQDGTWDAYKVENGKLVYKFEEDKRFEHFRTGQTSHPDYAKERALYYAMAEQFIREGAKNPDGSEFKVEQGKIIPLPSAHTSQEIESFKSLGDLIYGYYAHEKKSLMHYTFYGSLFMQMKTYWSGKKNQYLAPGGVRVQGHWVQAKDNEGKNLYYQVIDGKIRTDLEPVTENTGAPVVQWEGQWQEGIMVTLSTVARGAYQNWKEADNRLDIFTPFRQAVQEKYKNSEDMERAYYNNIKQLGYDLTVAMLIGGIVAGQMTKWEKDLEKEARRSKSFMDGLKASMVNILTMSVRNSASDFAFWDGIFNPALQWTPFSLETGTRLWKNVWNTAFGDRTFWGGVTNTFAATKQMRPLMQTIAPLTEPKQ